MKTSLPLHGIVVADFSRVLAGPLCTMLLADLGARVIKIEEPRGDETRRWGPPFVQGESAYFLSVNRNKESITINLKTREGRAVARRIVERADVVVDNFRRAQREKFGLTVRSIRRINRRAICCTITGFDPDGPDADLPGYDLLAQAAGGLMSITGPADGEPSKVGVALADVLTGHYAYGAICAALFARERSGRGEAIEVSLFGSTVASLVNVAQNYLVTGAEAKRYGNAHASIVPYQTFHAADRMFALAVATDRHFEVFCRDVLGEPELSADRRYRTNASRVKNRKTLVAKLEARFRTRRARGWVSRCREVGIPAALVRGIREVFAEDPSLQSVIRHTGVGDLALVRSPLRFSGRRLSIALPPPRLGEQTGRILRELGYAMDQIRELRALDAI